MAKRTLDIKPAKHLSKTEPLIYKDASDVSDGDHSSDDENMSDEEAEEEIKEIPLGQKRRHVDESFSDGEEGEADIDDSVSDSEDNSQSNGDDDMEDDEGPDVRIASSGSDFDDDLVSEKSELSAEIIRKKK
jgi:hypothetical protein